MLRPEEPGDDGALPSVLDPAAASQRPLAVAPEQVSVRPASEPPVKARASGHPPGNGAAQVPFSVPPAAPTPRELAPVSERRSERPPAESATAEASRPAGESAGDDDMIPTGQFEPVDKDMIATGQFDPIDKAVAEGPLVKGAPVASELEGEPVQERNADSEPSPQIIAVPAADARSSAQTREVRDSISSEPDFIATDERRSKSTMAGWALALLVLIAIGFVLGRRDEDSTPPAVEAIGKRNEQPAATPAAPEAPAPFGEPEKPAQASTVGQKPLAQGDAVVVPRDAGFEIFEGILDKSTPVKPEQALLMVDASAGLPQAELMVDGTKVGPLPAKVPLAEGVHELAIVSGDAVSYRFASVHRGKTWVLHAP